MYQRPHALKAYEMAILGLANTHIGYSDEGSTLINDIYWTCYLAHEMDQKHPLGCPQGLPYRLAEVISLIVKNVKCATVLSEILKGYALGATGLATLGQTSISSKRKHTVLPAHAKIITFDKPPLSQLLDAAVASYVNTTHTRLTHISPRHYGEFLEFLAKARDTFVLAPDGGLHFSQMLENMKLVYKGKKKLMALISERFG